MKPRLVIIRPQPGGDATAALAAEAGFDPVVMPLFAVEPVDWQAPPPGEYDALLIASANVLRHGGADLDRYRSLPVYAVGAQTARMATDAGFTVVHAGTGGIHRLLPVVTAHGHHRALRLSGADNIALPDDNDLTIDTVKVYAARALPAGNPPQWPGRGAIVALHSARAARHWTAECDRLGLARADIAIAAFAPAIAEAAGTGWRAVAVAEHPDDVALLSAAKSLANSNTQT